MMKEYNISPGQSNFRPLDPVGLSRKKDFRFQVAFHHSCYFSLEDYEDDRDWEDVNKLVMATLAYTGNNHNAYGVGFMPDSEAGKILVTPYTNFPGTDFTTNREESISVGTAASLMEAIHAGLVVEGEVRQDRRKVNYEIMLNGQRLEVSHPFKSKWFMPWIARRVGTYMGGANNSPGRFGGQAHKDMKLWLAFEYI